MPVRTWKGPTIDVDPTPPEHRDSAAGNLLTRGSSLPLDLGAAREHLVTSALRAGPVGAVGLELERHVLDAGEPLVRPAWSRVSGAVDGLHLPGGSRVTLEPGGQVEVSTAPSPGVADAVTALQRDVAVVDDALAGAGLVAVAVGADPARAPRRTNPGSRYAAMEAYFAVAGHGRDGAAMMCSTAALQVNLDAGPPQRWAQRLAHVRALAPVLTAMSACSPMLGGRDSGHRSARQAVWQRLDPARCRWFSRSDDPAQAWAELALEAPVMLVRDDAGRSRPPEELVTLRAWLAGERRLGGRCATLEDVDLHLSTLWPPVRLRGWLELRMLDTVPARWWPGLAAVVSAVVDDPVAADRAAEAVAPVAGHEALAARRGLGDPTLRRAAAGVVAAALGATPASLRLDVERWAELVGSGRDLADLVLDAAASDRPDHDVLAEELR